jgi:hypothetical protein
MSLGREDTADTADTSLGRNFPITKLRTQDSNAIDSKAK